jgi:endonuclease YncB( thermonuclease family)
MTLRLAAVAAAATVLMAPPPTAGAAKARVVRAADGDTVLVRSGAGKARAVHLAGVDAPARSECGARAAKRALTRLLPRRTRVRLVRDRRAGSARYVYRGRRLVNAAMLRAGAARAAAAGLRLAKRLQAAEAEAKSAGRGLWKMCAAPPGAPPGTPPPPPAGGGTTTGQAAIDRARADLATRDFTLITTPSSTSSSESHLNLCADGRYVEDVSTYSEYGGSTDFRYTGTWEVVEAIYTPQYAGAHVIRHNDDGTTGDVFFYVAGGIVYVNGNQVTVNAASLCG